MPSRVYVRHVPPERLLSRAVTATADVYQAGLTLYRMAVGPTEFERQATAYNIEDDQTAVMTGAFPDRGRHLSHIPGSLRRLMKCAMEPDPATRFGSVLELANTLALVDEALDWRYTEGSAWGEGTWSESGQGPTRRVTLATDGGRWSVHSCRVAGASGRLASSAGAACRKPKPSALCEPS